MKQLISIMLLAFICLKANAQKTDSIVANGYYYQEVANLVNFSELRYLKIDSYKGAYLPDIFDQFPKLEYLEISNLKIKNIPASIGKLSKLKTLIICNGRSDLVIPAEIGKLTQLRKLQIYNHHFTTVPAEIGNLVNLEDLMLCGDLTNLPESVSNWKNLKIIYLSGNKFKEIPSPIFRLTQLQDLDVSSNEISQLNDSISLLEELNKLSLSSNIELDKLPPGICKLEKLENLYLDNTKIDDLPVCLNQINSLKQIRMCKTVIDNPASIDSVFKEKMDWEWACHGLESYLVDFSEIYGNYTLNLNKNKDTVILNYTYSYNQPRVIDEEYTQNITIKILQKDSLKLNHVYTASNPHFIISSNHFSVWDWSTPKDQKIAGYLQFVELKKNEYKVYLNLELIEGEYKTKLVDKLLVFK